MSELLLIFFGAAYVNNLALAALIDRPQKAAASSEWGILVVAGMLLLLAILAQVFPQAGMLPPQARLYLDLLAFVSTVFLLSNSGTYVSTFTPALRRLRSWLPVLVGNLAVLAFVMLGGSETKNVVDALLVCLGASTATWLGIFLLPALHERIEFADMPRALRGTPIAVLTAALISLALMGALPW